MEKFYFSADNSKFGRVLVEVMTSHAITVSALSAYANMQKERVCQV